MHFNNSYQQKDKETTLQKNIQSRGGKTKGSFYIQNFFLVLWINESIYQTSSQSRENTGEEEEVQSYS